MEIPLQPKAIESAWSDYTAGRSANAEAACLEMLRQDSANPEALHLLGLIRFQTGRPAEGTELLECAVNAAPNFAAAQNDLGAMLVILGRPEEAVPRLRTVIGLKPGSAEAHLNLGNALHAQGQNQTAEEHYRQALTIDSKNVRANVSLGNLLRQMRRPQEALGYLSAAVALSPKAANIHQFLGKALYNLGRTEEAIESYRQAIALEPSMATATKSLGLALRAQNRLEEALGCFRTVDDRSGRALTLDCLLRLGRHANFFEDLEHHLPGDATNLESACLSAYVSHQLGRPDPHPFCPNPLDKVRIVDRYVGAGADAEFLSALIREASQVESVWEPRGVTTKRGFQTGGNLFKHGHSAMARLNRDLIEELGRYHADLGRSGMTVVTKWPGTMRLHGWFVRLLTGGHQTFHNHVSGWISGCLYLQMPIATAAGEGGIEFGLKGDSYPELSDRPLPTLLHNPTVGQIVLFPSSLYHRTIPFASDEERLCIAFDLLPD